MGSSKIIIPFINRTLPESAFTKSIESYTKGRFQRIRYGNFKGQKSGEKGMSTRDVTNCAIFVFLFGFYLTLLYLISI